MQGKQAAAWAMLALTAWLGCSAAKADDAPSGFHAIFNGRDLTGWEGRSDVWKVDAGMIVAESPGLRQNEFLASTKRYDNFVLTAWYHLVGGQGNSGIQFRSERMSNSSEMIGYQADVGEGYWGALYDESRRNKVLAKPAPESKTGQDLAMRLRKDGWNQYRLSAMGGRIRLWVNDVQTVDFHEPDPKTAADGFFGLQIHADNKPVRVEFKDLFIQELPAPVPAAKGKTGFVYHELKESDGASVKYVVFVPKGYNAAAAGKRWPVILFLHGSGETGVDGLEPCQVGLGPAIAARPDFASFAIFPQSAKRSWQAGGPDADRALRMLAEVQRAYQIDAEQIHLTGLSMGGNGTWTLAVQHPELWATATMVCGFGDARGAGRVAKLPMQIFCGDKDMAFIMNGTKAIEAALKAKGASATSTWYPGVGHNSWDNAYNTDSLYTWMFSHRRGAAKDQ